MTKYQCAALILSTVSGYAISFLLPVLHSRYGRDYALGFCFGALVGVVLTSVSLGLYFHD